MLLKNKVAIYIRVSTQLQIDKDSLQVQRRELAAYSELVLGINDYDVFDDPGYSGKDTFRPAYQRMMAKLRGGEYSHLLVWKIDRISRNLLDFASMYTELKRLGVTFISKNEQFDTSTAIGEAMLKIILVFAELERKMTAERVTSVMLSRASNGQWNGGRVPFGYDWDKETKTFSVNEEEAGAYQLMCSLYEERQSLLKVCEELNRRGIRTKAGRAWSPVTVRKVLTNVFYQGIYRYNVHNDGKGIQKRESSEWIDIEGHHPALIDQERFDHISYMLRRNVRKGPKKGDTYEGKSIHIFAGLVICGNCGANMTATKDRRRASGYRPSIYGCSSRRKKTKQCSNKFINDLALARVVFPCVSWILRAVDDKNISCKDLEAGIISECGMAGITAVKGAGNFIEYIGEGKSGLEYAPPVHTDSNDYSQLRQQRKKHESSLRRLQSIYLYGDDGISEKDYIIERKRITDKIDEIDSVLKDSDSEINRHTEETFREKASYLLMVDKLLGYESKDVENILRVIEPSVPKDFMNRIIDSIVVTDGTVSKITFKSGLSLEFIH